MRSTWRSLTKHLNFYRVHILFFTFTPLIFSGIFYASNGHTHISYIDALYNSVSAMTVCGLATVDLSSLTAWQQVILFIQMCLGSPVVVSWVMVYLRRYYFAKKFKHIIAAASARIDSLEARGNAPPQWTRRFSTLLSRKTMLSAVEEMSKEDLAAVKAKKKNTKGLMGSVRKLRPDMIRRMDQPPQLVNPSGWISEAESAQRHAKAEGEKKVDDPPDVEDIPLEEHVAPESKGTRPQHLSFTGTMVSSPEPISEEPTPLQTPSAGERSEVSLRPPRSRRLSDPGRTTPVPASPVTNSFPRSDTVAMGALFPRTQTVEFAPGTRRDRTHRLSTLDYESSVNSRRSQRMSSGMQDGPPSNISRGAKHTGFGGFPMPLQIARDLFTRFFPKLERKLTRTLTLPPTMTLASRGGGDGGLGIKPAPYISFDAIVGRNSLFKELTAEQQDELGGVEYRALNALLWIVAGYHIGIQLVAFTVIAPYISTPRWAANFQTPKQHSRIRPAWFALFQVVSAYTNTGMSLVDQSMVPFQEAYAMIVFLVIVILAGNTAFVSDSDMLFLTTLNWSSPSFCDSSCEICGICDETQVGILTRVFSWILSKFVPKSSRSGETLRFLLDHPRRCFIYLFPSHQTWFLATVVLFLNVTDWFFFMVLDIGNPAIESISLNTRFAIGLLQAIAVRAAGFGTVALSALAPAVKVLYLIMMYISVYPIAMSVRSTNVYEEQSLGIFRDGEPEEDEWNFQPHGESRMTVWSSYLAMHARKQLAFDMWWLGLAVFLVCIIEVCYDYLSVSYCVLRLDQRSSIDKEENFGWFNIFSVVFELVSAYGTVGLSLGIPTQNYSFSGAFRPLSKLIVCFVMIRGRHRGLPVAIDRAVMLPFEFAGKDAEEEENRHEHNDEDPREHTFSASSARSRPDDAEWRLRKTAHRQSHEEVNLSAARRNAARLDRDSDK
ncbi:unnamed protein product [Mycena citricolor]|uniref:Potassium transport protein n=1 Tax=Mycena citricolor TaxID=2018698 RepID=A0AAD2Q6J8_9AGAR|nr:unnamed protein product [Mycena citricolor]